ncbi:NUDIX domain-containing protein [Streptomyces sp. NPDC051315]|uniref:NUDIX hydrolase n=1 Tax=Streptomyces sp. NPDC051315 TaxID=3365650 RepID=UPI0037954373
MRLLVPAGVGRAGVLRRPRLHQLLEDVSGAEQLARERLQRHPPVADGAPRAERQGDPVVRRRRSRRSTSRTGLVLDGLTRFTVVDDTVQVFLGGWDGDPALLPVTEGIMSAFFDAVTTERLTMAPWAAEVLARHRADGTTPPPLSHGQRAVPNVIGVHLLLEEGGKVLLGLRHPDSPFAPLRHHFLAGHCEQESAVACLIREAREEAGLEIEAEDVELAHAVHVVDAPGGQPRLQLVFRARRRRGEPRLLEPDKCLGWRWWPLDALPDPMVPYARAALDGIRDGRLYTELGWD